MVFKCLDLEGCTKYKHQFQIQVVSVYLASPSKRGRRESHICRPSQPWNSVRHHMFVCQMCFLFDSSGFVSRTSSEILGKMRRWNLASRWDWVMSQACFKPIALDSWDSPSCPGWSLAAQDGHGISPGVIWCLGRTEGQQPDRTDIYIYI